MERSKIDNYVSRRGAEAYQRDHETKLHRRYSSMLERRILSRMLAPLQPIETILDLPCGTGRLLPLFAEHAERVIEADFSPSMLDVNASLHDRDCAYLRASALSIPLADHSVDVAVSIRLNHHFDRASDRARHVRELLRVARCAVIVTFFSHDSWKNRWRRLRANFTRKRAKSTLRQGELRALAREAGYRSVRFRPLSRWGSGHVFALLERAP